LIAQTIENHQHLLRGGKRRTRGGGIGWLIQQAKEMMHGSMVVL